MPKPALGRMVHTFVDPAMNNGSDIAPAIITRVWNDQGVNLRVVLDGTDMVWRTSVALFDDRQSAEKTTAYFTASNGDRIPSAAFWPPIV